MVKQTVDVFVRVRPKHPDLPSAVRVLPAGSGGVLRVIEANVPRGSSKGGWVNNTTERLQFTFQQVFDETATQDAVYSAVVAPLVSQFLEGVNCTVLAYGQTGSGKTYSMVGGGKYRDRGVIPRAIRAIFTALAAQAAAGGAGGKGGVDAGSCALYVSYCEIYEEKVFDLLDRANAERPIEMWPRVQVRAS
jgi:kinesin family member 6/9